MCHGEERGNAEGLGTDGSGRVGRSRSDPTMGGPGATPGRGEPKDLVPSLPCDFRWDTGLERGRWFLGSQTSGRGKSHKRDS